MSTWWSAGEFRRVRMVAVVAMAVGWAVALLLPMGCLRPECDAPPFVIAGVVFAAVFAGVMHLGLLLSFVAERGGPVVRLAGMALLLPSALLATEFTRDLLLHSQSSDATIGALCLAYGLAHVVQGWALTGIPFPRLTPLAPESDPHVYFFHTQTAAGVHPAADRRADDEHA